MRYRLRTLLIVVTLAGVFFGWTAYLRRMAFHHRQEADSLIDAIAQADNIQPSTVEDAIEWLAEGTAQEVRGKDLSSGRTVVSFRKQPPFFETDPVSWESAVYHRKMAATYDNALFYPWVMLYAQPAP